MKHIIDVSHVTFSFFEEDNPESLVLDDLCLSIAEGEFIALIGQNGSGKSTFAKLLNALLIPDKGTVLINGLDTRESANHSFIRRLVGLVFQRPQDQIVATTVSEDVAFGPSNLGLPPQKIRLQVTEALKATGLTGYEERPSYLLSAGETQRVALAGVVAMRPKCIVFDETTAMLDPLGREMVMRQAKVLNKEGITIIFITHLMEEAAQADRILVLQRGRLVMDDTPAEVYSSSSQIKSFGLDLPPVAQAAGRLRQLFPSLPNAIFSNEELFNALPKYSGAADTFVTTKKEASIDQDAISVTNLSHEYLRNSPLAHKSLNECDLNVGTGTTHGLIGATGSGKSTLLQHLNGLIRLQSGTVEVLNYSLNDARVDIKSLRRSVGLVFQQPEDQIFEQYVGDEIAFAARNFAVPGKIADLVEKAMQAVGLDFMTFKDRLTSTLSGGEKRKVGLASVLAAQPQILLLDEPLAGLDPLSRNEVISHLKELHKKGITLVISTHQFEGAVELMEKISVMSDGTDLIHDSPGRIFINEKILKSTGIKAPLVAQIVRHLRKLGWPIPEEVIGLDDLITSLSAIVSGGEG